MTKRSATAHQGRVSARKPFLAAALIVRDEEARIGPCLDALREIVDEIHVHDTGSTDSTPHLAALKGAHVSRGPWTDDFAAARNAALEGWSAHWVLSVDADETVIADGQALRRLLSSTRADVLNIAIDNASAQGEIRHTAPRLFRPSTVHWFGRLHEQLVGRNAPARRGELPPEVLRLHHVGYATAEIVRGKGARNAQIARGALREYLGSDGLPLAGHESEVARTLYDLGRSLMDADETQDAIDTFETVRELYPDTREWMAATDSMARIMLMHEMYDVGLTLILQMRGAGARPTYCDWLEGFCLARLGHVEAAQQLLAGVTEVSDYNGLTMNPQLIADFKADVDTLARRRTAAPV